MQSGHSKYEDNDDWVKHCMKMETEETRQRGCLKPFLSRMTVFLTRDSMLPRILAIKVFSQRRIINVNIFGSKSHH